MKIAFVTVGTTSFQPLIDRVVEEDVLKVRALLTCQHSHVSQLEGEMP